MKRPIIRPDLCHNCQPCLATKACDRRAFLREDPQDKPWIDFYQCGGCLRCKVACPNGAIAELTQPCTGRRRMGW